MDEYTVNERALVHAYDLIEHRRFVIGTDWDESHPTPVEQQAFIDEHSWDAFALWHLAIADDSPRETIARHQFALGDFHRVHRSALVSTVDRARAGGHHLLEEAAEELLHRLDAKAGVDFSQRPL